MELLYPLYRLKEEEVEVVVAGLDDTPLTGKKGHGPVDVDTIIEGLAASDFDALVIPGGYAPDKLRRACAVLDRSGISIPRTSRSPSSATRAGCRSRLRS